ncbi:MAG: hypothetical protein ABW133_14470 [Polyangiaceae bacterium]
MSTWAQWRGVAALIRDGVEHGSRAVERVQLETARRTFAILEQIPPIAAPTRVVHVVHDKSVGTVHAMIRGINAAVGGAIAVTLEQLE